jgi:hypothetical protein
MVERAIQDVERTMDQDSRDLEVAEPRADRQSGDVLDGV